MVMLLIRLFAILMLSTFELITFFWNQGVYTPTLKKHQVVRDIKKFENHWSKYKKGIAFLNLVTFVYHQRLNGALFMCELRVCC